MLDSNLPLYTSFIQEEATTTLDYAMLLQSMTENQSTQSRKLEEVEASTVAPPTTKTNDSVKTNVKAKVLSNSDMTDMQIRNILIGLPIVLVIILYYTIMSLIDMPIIKSSLLYAKYGSSKTSVQNQ